MAYLSPKKKPKSRWKRKENSTYTYRPERKGHDNLLDQLLDERDLLLQNPTEESKDRLEEIMTKVREIGNKGYFSNQLIDVFL